MNSSLNGSAEGASRRERRHFTALHDRRHVNAIRRQPYQGLAVATVSRRCDTSTWHCVPIVLQSSGLRSATPPTIRPAAARL